MPQILIVCTANICRSPVVAALLAQRLEQSGLADWQIESAGTWATFSRGAARYSIQLMAEQGLDIKDHRAKMINEQLIVQSDLVLCMELGHVEALHVEFKPYKKRIFALSEMVGKRFSIEDPYGGTLNDYREMVAEVTQLLDDGLLQIVSLTEANYLDRTVG
jgi:protein-tyrosine-phosphatase